MRTTLNIDDDLLIAIKEVAKRDSRPAGAVASELLRQSLARSGSEVTGGREEGPVDEFGFRPFPKRGDVVTNELIDRLREDDEFEHLCTEMSKAFSSYAEDEVDSPVLRVADTVLTALVLAGGADGIHKMISSFKSFRSSV